MPDSGPDLGPTVWNYRVVLTADEWGESYEIAEVYYERAGGPIRAWSGPATPYGDTYEELRDDLAKMAEAFGRGTIDVADLPTRPPPVVGPPG